MHTSIKMSPVEFRKKEQEKIKDDKNYFNNKKNILKKLQEENIM